MWLFISIFIVSSALFSTADEPRSITSSPGPPNNHNSRRKNSLEQVDKYIREIHKKSTGHALVGLVAIPKYKLAICLQPKAGCTTLKFILMKLAGNRAEEICGCFDRGGEYAEYGCLGYYIDHIADGPLYDGVVFVDDEIQKKKNETLLREIFQSGDRDWTTVAAVRDPWGKAISAYTGRNHMEDNLTVQQQRTQFSEYLSGPSTVHSKPLTYYCGLSHLKYDHYVEVDKGLEGLHMVLQTLHHVPTDLLFYICLEDKFGCGIT